MSMIDSMNVSILFDISCNINIFLIKFRYSWCNSRTIFFINWLAIL